MKKIYLASPFFNEAEIKSMETVRDILRQKGLDVFVPNEHQSAKEFGSLEWRKETFGSDVSGIDNADVMVAIINQGNYDDSGTAWEIGYAYATKKPVILVNVTGETINLMIADSIHALVTSYEELKEYDFNKLEKKPYTNYVW
ncbi:nucleoside 2-deoxyribosyltransferase [Romboutsia ilealis]|uniref:nucleoside 2-deoxyribosyltransferase n=1 Tax=Romboutsia ilealis TaxID=1115758 RepID=UPI0026F3BBAB|nr:nucleoside 2-deoxyribosyltransferase [Romboutsia ilealis]